MNSNGIRYGKSKVDTLDYGAQGGAYVRIEEDAAFLAGSNNCFWGANKGSLMAQTDLGGTIALNTLAIEGPMHMHTPFPISCIPFVPPAIPFPPFVKSAPMFAELAKCMAILSCPA